jgi:hypothetical protein
MELDFLRGLAACLMIANHLGFASASYDDSKLVALMTFVGGMAPVLFFLVSGLGQGVQSASGRTASLARQMPKLLILFMADAFLWLRPGQVVGNDFIGFIALSSLILEIIRRSRRSLSLSAGLILLIILARFGLGPLLRTSSESDTYENALAVVLGAKGLEGFSYPISPWLVYPLMGYALGRVAAVNWQQVQTRKASLILGFLVLASIPIILGLVVVLRGRILFRFGTMSLGFFLLSLATVFIALAVSLLLSQIRLGQSIATVLSLSGVRSFAVVPLHYLFLDFTRSLWGKSHGAGGYLLWVFIGVIFSFQLSKAVPWSTQWFASRGLAGAARLFILAGVVVAAATILTGSPSSSADHLVRQAAQLGLCILFGLLPASGRHIKANSA